MNIFGIGLPEMAVIAAIGLLVFGPKRLPELGKTLGRTLRGFQTASQEFEQEFRGALQPDRESTTALDSTSTPEPPTETGSAPLPSAADSSGSV
jgi:sec-independent protein translocase protein TatA